MASNHGSVVYWMTGPVHVPHRRPSTCPDKPPGLQENLDPGLSSERLLKPSSGRM
jgi:hypothetical protein